MSDKKEGLTFEETMEKLEAIATELEKGELTLDKSVEKFEEGMELSKQCSQMLENAEKRITKLIQTEDGEAVEESFNTNTEE